MAAGAAPEQKPAESTVVKKGLSLPTKPRTPEPASPAPPPPSEPDDWLSRLRGTLPAEQPEPTQPESPVPDWLRDVQEPEATPGQLAVPAFDLSARLGDTTPTMEAEVPDWLSRLSTPSAEPPTKAPPAPEPEMPDWLKPSPAAAPPRPAPPAQAAQAPDWLTSLPTTPAVPASLQEADVPDWLKQPLPSELPTQVQPAAEAQVPDWLGTPSAAPAEAETPDWLRQILPATREQAAPEPPASGMTGWLSQLPPVPQTTETRSPAAAVSEGPAPDWLTGLAPAPIAAEPAGPATTEPSATETPEVPDWFSRLPPTEEPSQALLVSRSSSLATESEMPDWLANLSPLAAVPEPELPQPAPVSSGPAFVGEPESAPEETPSWLTDLGEPEPPPSAPALTETPDWLKELETQAPPTRPELEAEMPSPFAEPVPIPPGEMPDWLKDLKPVEAGAPTDTLAAPAFVGATGEGGLVAAQLPSWLQALGPKEAPVSAPPVPQAEPEPEETEGILAGVRGPLPIAALAAQALGAGVSLSPAIPAGDLSRAGALQELVARGAETLVRQEGDSRAQRLLSGTQRAFVFIVIALAVIAPLVYSLNLVQQPVLPVAGEALYNQINALKPGERVLVMFDYDASQSPEMDVMTHALLRHLVARQANIETASLYPAGPAAAQVVLSSVVPVTSAVKVNTVNKGYLPGQAAAAAALAVDARQYKLMIEIAATPDTLRWWAEQMTTQSQVPLYAAVSASVEAVAQPYVASGQIKGLLAGVPNAVAYQFKLRSTLPQQEQRPPSELLAPVESIGAAIAALVLLMVLGVLFPAASGRPTSPGDGRGRK